MKTWQFPAGSSVSLILGLALLYTYNFVSIQRFIINEDNKKVNLVEKSVPLKAQLREKRPTTEIQSAKKPIVNSGSIGNDKETPVSEGQQHRFAEEILSPEQQPKSRDDDDDDNDVCSFLSMKTFSPASIWTTHLNQIFNASRHAEDKVHEYRWHDFTARLLNLMTPQRLQLSIKALPSRYWKQVGNVLNLAWERYQFLKQKKKKGQTTTAALHQQQSSSEEPRKVNILVMGGSVTMGVLCRNNPVQSGTRFSRRSCAWPTRLGHLLNALFEDIFSVHYITLGGSNTESATNMWNYALFPSDMPHPDVLIHAYSTNDMHVLSEKEAIKRNITLEDMILEVNQKFIRTVLKEPQSCKDRPNPLLHYYDDYIGNEQKEILKTYSFSKAANTLAGYYGFGLTSYADAARHLVYGDTNEEWFSPDKWPERQVHPGMGMHIASMWLVAFNFLNMATTYCSGFKLGTVGGDYSSGGEFNYEPMNGLPVLRNMEELRGVPKPTPSGLPPILNKTTSLDTISSIWQNDARSTFFDRSGCKDSDYSSQKPCTFSWIGGLEVKFEKTEHLTQRMNTVLTENDGWEASIDNEKLGYQATKEKAVFEVKVQVTTVPIETINFMVMTSYGEKWADSKIRVDASVDRNNGKKADGVAATKRSMEIAGFHDRHTSETYNYQLVLADERAELNDFVRLRVTLIGGSTFKFMGMAFCDH